MQQSTTSHQVRRGHIILEEQGLRDGLQMLPQPVPTEIKLEWISSLVRAGLKRLQIAAFVHPGLLPQMADAEIIFRALEQQPGVVYSALALNHKGVERAVASGVRHLAISLSASNTHSLKNTRMDIETAKADFVRNVKLARKNNIVVRSGIQCAFGCRYEGAIPRERVYDLVRHHLDSGVEEIALADSTGMANPWQVREMMEEVLALCGQVPVALHLHNTENKGLANVFAAMDAGIRQFDTAFGGLGGCPFIRSATGNIATEDTAHMLHQAGFTTGIDISGVAKVSIAAAGWLGHPLPGMLYPLVAKDN
jgi:hydroxymethylglutaryl-CoA lyase